jgi:hypothetical protein
MVLSSFYIRMVLRIGTTLLPQNPPLQLRAHRRVRADVLRHYVHRRIAVDGVLALRESGLAIAAAHR